LASAMFIVGGRAIDDPEWSTSVVRSWSGTSTTTSVWWTSGPATARSIVMVLAPLVVPLVLHLALASPSGRVSGHFGRAALGVAYLATATLSTGRAMFRDPFLDLGCWNNCRDNIFLVGADRQLVARLDGFWRTTVIVVAAVTVTVARLVRASRVARRAMVVLAVPAALAAIGNAWFVVSEICAHRGSESSRPRTPRAATSSATSTAARSSVCSPRRSSFVKHAPQRHGHR
jgi:hypothetical protein